MRVKGYFTAQMNRTMTERERERKVGSLVKQLFFLMRFEILTAVKTFMLVLGDVTSCGLPVQEKLFG